MKYGRWTILNEKKVYKNDKVYLSCLCECGTKRDVIIKNLKSGISKSCGCVGSRKTIERNTKHGLRYTRTWTIWRNMKSRCYNKNLPQYKNWGGRGIKVCDEWKDDFLAFYNFFGDIPKGKSIDRIDNDGNYEPGNVRLSTAKEQCSNKSNNRKINGICISEISKTLGGKHSLVAKRLKRGWSLERAITEKSYAK
jgi:hypothetical protein